MFKELKQNLIKWENQWEITMAKLKLLKEPTENFRAENCVNWNEKSTRWAENYIWIAVEKDQ